MAGSGGMLGDAFFEVFKDDFNLKCTDINISDKWISYLDFRNFDQYFQDVKNFKSDYLFHLGAFTDLEFCEKNVNDTYLTNTLSVENAVWISNKLNIPLLFISTAGIFDGKKEFYDDWDIPNPLGHYAKSKYASERYVQLNSKNYLICRAGWMMGGGQNKDKKFINKIYKIISSGAKEINIVDDKVGTPTYTYDFANNVKAIIKSNFFGLYNLVCEGNTTRLLVAMEMLKILNLENKINIKPVSSNFFKKEYFAPRPNSENLINRRLNLRSLNLMRDWKICLEEYLINEYNK